jgi:hypothetical protein
MEPNASTLVTLGIPAIALVVIALTGAAMVAAVRPERRLVVAAIFTACAALWLGLTAALALSGFFADFESRPPHVLALMVPMLVLPFLVAFSPMGRALAERTPLAPLVAFHAFRLPLELVMHEAAREGTMPVQMSFSGANFDIVTGASAIVVALLVARGRAPRWLVVAFNVLGSVLLIAIGAIAIASLPLFRAFGVERVNTWVAYFPFVWLPAVLVSCGLLGHLVLWRRLFARSAEHVGRGSIPTVADREGAVAARRARRRS